MDPCNFTGTEILEAVRTGSLTVRQVVQALLDRIEERQPTIRAWTCVAAKEALERADQLDALHPDKRGPLHGLPIGIKDVILTKDLSTTYNSTVYGSFHPEIDAACITVLRNAGAVILGKTKTTQFAATFVGTDCANPKDTNRTPGGSSSGSAAAVSDLQVPVALGTQTVGSVVRPSAYTGILGYKPTWGTISMEGVKLSTVSLDTLGFFSRSVQDLKIMASAFQIPSLSAANDAGPGIKGARFGVCYTSEWPSADEDTQNAIRSMVKLLTSHGALVDDIPLPSACQNITRWASVIRTQEGRSAFLNEHITNHDELAPNIRDFWKEEADPRGLLEAYDGFSALRVEFEKICSQYCAVIAPSVTGEAPLGLDHTGEAIFAAPWTSLHFPVINIPGFLSRNGLPVGVSLVGSRFHDAQLLQVAESITALMQQ